MFYLPLFRNKLYLNERVSAGYFNAQGPVVQKLEQLNDVVINVSLKLWSLNTAYMLIFCWKMWVDFALQKLLTFFFSKNTCEFDTVRVLIRAGNILTNNEHTG